MCACARAQSRLTLCDPTDCSPPRSSVHGTSQARILEWVAISSSRGSSQTKHRNCISCIAGGLYLLSHQEITRQHLLKKAFQRAESGYLGHWGWKKVHISYFHHAVREEMQKLKLGDFRSFVQDHTACNKDAKTQPQVWSQQGVSFRLWPLSDGYCFLFGIPLTAVICCSKLRKRKKKTEGWK